MSSSFPRTIFRVPVALADFLTQIDQHDTEPRTQNAAQQAVTQTSTNFRILRSKKVAALQQKDQESVATNDKVAVLLQLSLLWRASHTMVLVTTPRVCLTNQL